MNEIGKPKTIHLTTTTVGADGKRRRSPKLGADGTRETKVIPANVWRTTRHGREGACGRAGGRKLVGGRGAPDMRVRRPEATGPPPGRGNRMALSPSRVGGTPQRVQRARPRQKKEAKAQRLARLRQE